MGTTLRAELSEKNPYWIEKHRYYELKHFCLQYPIWKKIYRSLDGFSGHYTSFTTMVVSSTCNNQLHTTPPSKLFFKKSPPGNFSDIKITSFPVTSVRFLI